MKALKECPQCVLLTKTAKQIESEQKLAAAEKEWEKGVEAQLQKIELAIKQFNKRDKKFQITGLDWDYEFSEKSVSFSFGLEIAGVEFELKDGWYEKLEPTILALQKLGVQI